ncbi:hypothetical protein FJZ31_01730 [Candidatus Poribacteria bacterium]|nr:hypothetical protein [Candidatus Poribacteria bacterium]
MAKKKRKTKQEDEHNQFLTTKYDIVIEKGRELSEIYRQQEHRGDDWRIYNYYSRPDIQRAIFEYARGRKITVLRHFRALYPEIKAPADILYISLYHAERSNLWPSLHGQISRRLENGEHGCDFVIEIDYKQSWETCFRATRPIIEMFLDFGVHACVKFSGHRSAHVIIPAEIFPIDKRSQGVRSHLMQFVGSVVKHSEKLDRSFTSPAHFLRLAYSINEKTGLVSLPVRLEEFDNFFWQEAKLEEVKVIDDWWGMVPADAQERMSEFLKFALHLPAPRTARQAGQKQFTVKKKREAAKQFQQADVKPKIESQKKIVALQQMTQPLTDHQLYDSMLESAGEELKQYEDKLGQKNIMTAIEHLKQIAENQAIISLQEHALEHNVELNDLWLVWRWELCKHDLEYYAKFEIQKAMYDEAQNRRIQVGSDGPFVRFRSPQDIYWLAIFLHSHLGVNEHPAFYRSVANYDAQDRFMIDYDIVLETDGRGNHQKSVELMETVVKVLQELGVTFDLRFTGGVNLQAVIPSLTHTEKSPRPPLIQGGEADDEQQSVLVESIRERLAATMRELELVKSLKHDELILLTHSLNEFTGKPCVPVAM